MTAQQQLRQIVEELPEEEALELLRFVQERQAAPLHKTASAGAFGDALRRLRADVPTDRPPLPDAALSRETIYP